MVALIVFPISQYRKHPTNCVSKNGVSGGVCVWCGGATVDSWFSGEFKKRQIRWMRKSPWNLWARVHRTMKIDSRCFVRDGFWIGALRKSCPYKRSLCSVQTNYVFVLAGFQSAQCLLCGQLSFYTRKGCVDGALRLGKSVTIKLKCISIAEWWSAVHSSKWIVIDEFTLTTQFKGVRIDGWCVFCVCVCVGG